MEIFLIIAAVIIAIRLSLPFVSLYFLNQKLKKYSGHAESIGLSFLRSKVLIKDIELTFADKDGKNPISLSADEIDIDLKFAQLIHKRIKGIISVTGAVIKVIKNQLPASSNQNGSASSFNLKNAFESFVPFQLDIILSKSKFQFDNQTGKAPVEFTLDNLELGVRNLSNGKISDDTATIADICLKGTIYDGSMFLRMQMNPLMSHPTFDMNAEVKNINLVLLNPYLRAHARLDVNSGRFGMFTEVACKDGSFNGYIKPIITDLDVVGPQDKNDNIFTRLWEGFVAGAYQMLKNKKRDQVATKILIKGNLENPHINVVAAVASILKNGFIKALTPSIDDVVNMESVKKFTSKSLSFLRRAKIQH